MVSQEIIDQYLKAGKRLTLLADRRPILDDWTNLVVPREKLVSHKGNLGWALDKGDLVIDIDPRNGGEPSFAKLCQDLNLSFEPTVATPRGGLHIYLKVDGDTENLTFKKKLDAYPGLDFLTKGMQCVIPTSSTENGVYAWVDKDFGGFTQNSAPKALIELIGTYKLIDDLSDSLESYVGLSTVSEDKAREMIQAIDPSLPNDDWVKVGMALHNWDPVLGLELWEEWSKGGDNYTEGETEKRWRSFKDNAGGITFGTIAYMMKSANYDKEVGLVNQFEGMLDKAKDMKTVEFDIIPKVRKANLSPILNEQVAISIQTRARELLNIKVPIAKIRSAIAPPINQTNLNPEESQKPEWTKAWLYVNSHTSFVNLKTLEFHKTESFNLECGKYVPMTKTGAKTSATKFVADNGFIRKVDSIAYLPTYDGRVCKIDGRTILNCFNAKSLPIEATEYTDEGLAAIELIKKHIKFICSTDENVDIFTQWLSHQIKYPGRQILWSPVIQSIQGIGKSFFGELLRACLGDRNVGTVSPTQLTSDFNGWANGVIVNVLEELRVKGHNRFDAVNALKPLITDRMIQINEKGVKHFITYNTTNYICFTNYRDALPLEQDDRRWWIIFVPILSLNDLHKYVGEDAKTYFPRLFDSVRTYAAEIRKWLLEYEITDEFLNTKQAPMNNFKESMIATEEASTLGFVEAKDLIMQGGRYYNQDVISSSDLFNDLMFKYPEMEFKTTQRNLLLKRLGFSAISTPIKLDGISKRVWARELMTSGEAKKMLENLEPPWLD